MKQLMYLCLVLFLAGSVQAQNLKPWKVNQPAGKQLKVSTKITAKIGQEMMGQKIDIEMNSTSTDSVSVKSETKGSFNLSKTPVALTMHINAMGKDVDFDSNKKEDMEGEMGQKMAEKLNVPVDVTVYENGQIKLQNPSQEGSAADAMGSLMPLNNDSTAIAGIFLPPAPQTIKPGETWKDSVTTPEMSNVNVYTFDKIENNIAIINYTSLTNTSGTTTANGMEVKVKMKTEATGVLKVNTKTGLVIERKADMKLDGTSEVMGMQIPITGTSSALITITEL